ncbi:MAG: GNAT family N-acetyltransferase [Clostridiales bacterium]|nr:GNAT family N-acetyltransferase [Clostridiales bacterium]
MKKLFAKSEIWFAVLWICLYVLGFGNADSLSEELGVPKLLTVIVGAVLTGVLWIFIRKESLEEYVGLCRLKGNGKGLLYFLPLVLISTVNFWNGLAINTDLTETVLYILSMCFVGFLEEVIFRGLLFQAMGGVRAKSAVIVAAVTFGMGHAVNLLLGAPLFETLLQLVYASAIGFCYIAVFCTCGSIWPCIISHAFINSTSIFAVSPDATGSLVIAVVQTVLGIGFGCWLFRSHKGSWACCTARSMEEKLNFRPAKEGEKQQIFALYGTVKGTAFCVWEEDYPGNAELEHDFETGNLFVLEEEGRIAGAISILPENELDDLELWSETENAFEFARVAVAPELQGKGLAAKLVNGVETIIRQRGGKWIHILAAPENLPAVRTYEKLGYTKQAECFAFGHNYLALEKDLR